MLALCKPFTYIVYNVEIDFFKFLYYIYVYNALKKPSTNHYFKLPQVCHGRLNQLAAFL
jgi:hypothetical protein